MNLIHGVTSFHGFRDDEDALVGRLAESFVDVIHFQHFILHKAVHSLTYHAETFLYGLLESAADSHHFAYGLHARTQFAIHSLELAEVPTRNLAYHIVESRLKESRRGLGHRVFQVEETIAETQFRCHESERITSGF